MENAVRTLALLTGFVLGEVLGLDIVDRTNGLVIYPLIAACLICAAIVNGQPRDNEPPY